MATMLGLHGINFADGTNKITANISGVMRIYNSSTSNWDSVGSFILNTTALIDSINFLNHAFFVNGQDSNRTYNTSGTWSTTTNVSDSPISKYIEKYNVRVFLGNITLRGTRYRSRVWYSDLPKNNAITWGIETGTNLSQTSGSAVVTSSGSTFITNNIKVGDKLLIEDGSNAGEYIVRSIDSNTQLTLTAVLSNTVASSNFWVGGNFFDVETDDGDEITGFGANSNELLIFKRLSLHRYNTITGNSLRRVKKVPGTGSFRSIVNENEYTYYHDPTSSAIRRYDGSNAIIISNGIEDILEGVSSSMIDNVVGFSSEGKFIEFYLGDITTRDGETITDCVVRWDTITETWSTRSLPWGLEQSTKWIQDSKPHTFVGSDNGKVLKVGDGYTYDTTAIGLFLQDQQIFPEGDDVLVDFQRVRAFIENGLDIQLMYRIWYTPKLENDRRWTVSEWIPLTGKADSEMVEFVLKADKIRRGSGIQLRFIESSSGESPLIEKYIVYYSNPSIR